MLALFRGFPKHSFPAVPKSSALGICRMPMSLKLPEVGLGTRWNKWVRLVLDFG